MLVGMWHHWEFDEMFGSYVIEEQDAERKGTLDGAEIAFIQANVFSNLRDYDYFTHVRIDGKDASARSHRLCGADRERRAGL